MRDQRYLTHYPSLGQDIGLLAAVAVPLCLIMAGMLTLGDAIMWVVGTLDVALLGPIVFFLARNLRVSRRLGRHRAIRFSIDLEGVYDGETRIFLPWSRVTSVKIAFDESATILVVTGWASYDLILDDRWAPVEWGTDVVTFFHTIVGPKSAVESAVWAFAPQMPIERISQETMRLMLKRSRASRTTAT